MQCYRLRHKTSPTSIPYCWKLGPAFVIIRLVKGSSITRRRSTSVINAVVPTQDGRIAGGRIARF